MSFLKGFCGTIFGGMLVMILVLVDNIKNKLNKTDYPNKKSKPQPKTVNAIDSEEFEKGADYTWFAVQTILYKLYAEEILLDYDSIYQELINCFTEFHKDRKVFEEWNAKYIEYVKTNDNLGDIYDDEFDDEYGED